MVKPICSFGSEKLLSVVKGFLQLRAAHTGFNCDGLVDFVERNHLVEAKSHVQGNTALDAFNAAGNG